MGPFLVVSRAGDGIRRASAEATVGRNARVVRRVCVRRSRSVVLLTASNIPRPTRCQARWFDFHLRPWNRRPAIRAGRVYQCTPFIKFAIATCSIEAFSSGSFSPFAAAESGKTLNAMCRIWSTALGARA